MTKIPDDGWLDHVAAERKLKDHEITKVDNFLAMVRIWVERDGGDMDAMLAWMYRDADGFDACRISQLSSRICERGTHGCDVVHGVENGQR